MTFLGALVWIGTVTFAASGALQAVRKRFDLVGVLVLALVTSVGGGSIRDVIVGALPPSALRSGPLLWGAVLTGVVVFMVHGAIREDGPVLYALDTLGLAVFAALGAQQGLTFGLGFWGAVFAGVLSGVGGGVLRDLLSGETPVILYRAGDFYATAAAAGGISVYLLQGADPSLALIAGVAVTVGVRVGSRRAGLRLPVRRE